MDLKQLKSFFYVAETGSFSAAAKWCNITQSAVSQHVMALEQELDARLILRQPKGLKLTEEGERMYLHARDILHLTQQSLDDIASMKGELKGTLRIGVGSFIAPIIRVAVFELMDRYPGVFVTCETGRTKTLNTKLRSGELDLAFTMNSAEKFEGIESKPCVPFHISAIVPRTHPLASHKFLTMADIEPYQVVLPDAGRRVYDTINRYVDADLSKLRRRCLINAPEEALHAALHFNAITFMPAIYVQDFPQLVAIPIKELDGELWSNVHRLRDVPLKRISVEFLNIIRDYAIPYLKTKHPDL